MPRPEDIALKFDLYKEARREKLTLSQFLEKNDPSSAYGPNEKLDAFDRQLKRFDIRVRSNDKLGIYADTVDKFYLTEESKVLFPEFISRVAREAMVNESILPWLIAITTPIEGTTYEPYYVDDQPTKQSKKRVTEAAELPRCKITGRSTSVKLYKYGRAIEASYEAIRRMRVDMLALHVRRIGAQASLDKATEALSVIVSGDGNANTAAQNYRLNADLGGVIVDGLDYESWMKFLMKFYPYNCRVIIGGEAELLNILTLQMPTINPLTLLAMLQGGQPVDIRVQLAQDIFNTVTLIYLPDAGTDYANKLIGMDNRYALEYITEIGSDISESERFVLNQTSVLTVSENNAFATMFPRLATKTLQLNA